MRTKRKSGYRCLIQVATYLLLAAVTWAATGEPVSAGGGRIDRHALVTRHKVALDKVEENTPLQVGNGNFAFNADVTGLQTFGGLTLSNWGWHEEPLPAGMKPEDRQRTEFVTHGRKRYYLAPQKQPELTTWLYDILAKLSRPPVKDGVYIDAESQPDVWNQTSSGRFLRPAWFEVYSCVRGPMIEPAIMEKTYERASRELRAEEWKGNLWGCDYPMLAMTAARLGKPGEAVDWLLCRTGLNDYAPNGFCAGWYLPGNGGLLWAVAMMAAGWDECPDRHAPGFPSDGSWVVKWEGLKKAP